MGVLISKSLIDSYISHEEFASVNNALRECNETKEEIKNPENVLKYTRIYYIKTMETCCVRCKRNTANKMSSVMKIKQISVFIKL